MFWNKAIQVHQLVSLTYKHLCKRGERGNKEKISLIFLWDSLMTLKKSPMNYGRANLHPSGVKLKKEKTLNVHGQKEPRFAKHNV